MAKRKAVDLPKSAPSPTRRKTRSSGPLSQSQAVALPNKKRRGRPPGIPASEIARSPDSRRSSKENEKRRDFYRENDSNIDELDLLGPSSSKTRAGDSTPSPSTPPATGKRIPRKHVQTLDAVVITTPKSFNRTPQKLGGFAAGSPSPSRPARGSGRVSPSLSRHEKGQRTTGNQSQRLPESSLPSSLLTSATLPDTISPSAATNSPTKAPLVPCPLPRTLPSHLLSSLQSQKSAVLHSLQDPPLWTEDDETTATSVFVQMADLLKGTTQRNEGNSCLILGPRGSGKSRLINRVLASLPSSSTSSPLIIRLSAHCQTNDRLAMREIARQIKQQIGPRLSLQLHPDKDEEQLESTEDDDGKADIDLPPPSQLPTLISALPALGRPVVVILDAFDGFAAHARQALLYCLLDTVQSCRGGSNPMRTSDKTVISPSADPTVNQSDGGNPPLATGNGGGTEDEHAATPETVAGSEHGLLVIGVTSRVDCLTLLEKRVKSRFSHRVMRVRTPPTLDVFIDFMRCVLCVDVHDKDGVAEDWKSLWTVSVESFLADKSTLNVLRETFSFVKDLRVLCRLMTTPVIALTPSDPWLTAPQLSASVALQRCPKRFPFLSALPYPHIALLIAAAHTRTAGHDTFNFETLYDTFEAQVRTSASALVQVEGSGIGMVKVGRGVMMSAFEHLVTTRVFNPVTAPTAHITREFTKYRCVAEWGEIKAAVEHHGQTNLKKWFSKAQ